MAEKMQICAIVSEYNPFHNGHAYHIKKTRQNGATHIVAVMSGNFVQRGDAAVLSKWARTEMALCGGVDLVLELPLPFSIAGAEKFAFGAVSLANALGCIDMLSFGSECAEEALLLKTADAVLDERVLSLLKDKMRAGLPFAAARERAAAELYGPEIAAPLKSPNDILGVEYIKALKRLSSPIRPLAIKRAGAGHDEGNVVGSSASASYLRETLLGGALPPRNLMPEDSFTVLEREFAEKRAPASLSYLDRAILSRLRAMGREEFQSLPDVSEGLHNRIYDAVQISANFEGLLKNIATKRYTHSRIRRIILSAFLNLPAKSCGAPPYLRVLGFNAAGREILKKAKRQAALPIITKASECDALPQNARELLALEENADSQYALCQPAAGPCKTYWTTGTVRI